MSSEATQAMKTGPLAKRGPRNAWAEGIEEDVISLAPYPISYDVVSNQPVAFSEFSYTELAGGLWVTTQSIELNCKLLQCASKEDTDKGLEDFVALLEDKYVLGDLPAGMWKVKRVCFLPGHNKLDVVNIETLSRLAFEDDDLFFKPHPITNPDALKMIGKKVGFDKVLPKDVSGTALVRQCEEIFTTSASEMCITATALGKKVTNISSFNQEATAAYHPISRLLFVAHRRYGLAEAQRILKNLIHSEWSGMLFPFHGDKETVLRRAALFYNKSLTLRNIYRELASPVKGKAPALKPKPRVE